MKKIFISILAVTAMNSAIAGPYTDAMSRCFANATTGKDRIDLARWIFSSIALHPEVADIASLTAEQREAINKRTGRIFTHLLAESCSKEFKDANKFDGSESIKVAFRFLGELAMQELTSNPEVAANIGGIAKYADVKKIETAIKE